jgi:hypothetical protein
VPPYQPIHLFSTHCAFILATNLLYIVGSCFSKKEIHDRHWWFIPVIQLLRRQRIRRIEI